MAIRFPYMNRYGVDPNDDKDDPFRRQERPDTLVSPPDTTVASASAELMARADSILGITREPTVASASAELMARADSILGITREPVPGLVPEPSPAVPAYAFSPAVQAERSGTGLTSILTSGTPPTGQLSPTVAFSPAVQAKQNLQALSERSYGGPEVDLPSYRERVRRGAETKRRVGLGPGMRRLLDNPAMVEQMGPEVTARMREEYAVAPTEEEIRQDRMMDASSPILGSADKVYSQIGSGFRRATASIAEQPWVPVLNPDYQEPTAEQLYPSNKGIPKYLHRPIEGSDTFAETLRTLASDSELLTSEAGELRDQRIGQALDIPLPWAERIGFVADAMASGTVFSAAIMLTGPLATPAMWMHGMGEIDKEAEDKGLTKEERNFLAEAGTALIYAKIEKLSEYGVAKSPVFQKLAGRFEKLLGRGLESDILSGGTPAGIMARFGIAEMIEEMSQTGIVMGYTGAMGEGQQYTKDEIFKALLMSAMTGAIGSVPIGAFAAYRARGRASAQAAGPLDAQYAALGLDPNASMAEVDKAFRDLASQVHPDRNPGDAEAEAQFKVYSEARADIKGAFEQATQGERKEPDYRDVDDVVVESEPRRIPVPRPTVDERGSVIYPDAPTIGPQVRFDDLGRPIPTTVSEPVIEPTPTAIPAPTLSLDERIEAATRIDPQDRMPRPWGDEPALDVTERKRRGDQRRYEQRVERQEGDLFPEPVQGAEESREAYRARVIKSLEEMDARHIALAESNAERLRAMPEEHQEFLLDKWEASPVESYERLRDIIGEQEQRIADGKPAQEEFSPELLARLQVLVDSDHKAAKYAAGFQRSALGGTNAYTAESLEEQVSTIEGKIRGDIPMGSVEQQPSTDPEVLDLFSKPRARPARVPEPEISTPSEVAPGVPNVILGATSDPQYLETIRQNGWGRMEIAAIRRDEPEPGSPRWRALYDPNDRQGLEGSGETADQISTFRQGTPLQRMPNEPYAVDTGAYIEADSGDALSAEGIAEGLDVEFFEPWHNRVRQLAKADPKDHPFMVVLPDVPQLRAPFDSNASLEMSRKHLAQAPNGLPYYFPVQDGMTLEQVSQVLAESEGKVAGIFLGGSDNFKVNEAQGWANFARENELKFHFGRAGTVKTLRLATEVGATSVDSAFPLFTRDRFSQYEKDWLSLQQGGVQMLVTDRDSTRRDPTQSDLFDALPTRLAPGARVRVTTPSVVGGGFTGTVKALNPDGTVSVTRGPLTPGAEPSTTVHRLDSVELVDEPVTTVVPPAAAVPPVTTAAPTEGGVPVVRTKLGGEPVPVPTTEPKVTSLLDEPTISRTKQAAFYLNPMAEGDVAGAADVEPERFQYKDFKNKKGETHVLKDVTKWVPERSGVIAVWRDPADNRYKVINGHQRWALAQRLGITEIRAIEIPAENAEQARARGALMNIGEGSGTAIDAAKVMRDTNLTPTDLKAQGVSLRGQLVKDATALANLPDGLFSLVAREKIPIRRAVSLGKADLTHSQQWAVWEKVKAEEAEGRKRVTNDELEEMARFVKAAPLIKRPDAPAPKTGDQPVLFGEEYIPTDLSLAVPKARLSAWAKKELARVANNFKFNSNVARAEMLKAAEVGELDPNLAGEIAKKAEAVKAVYNTLSDKAGPISDALNRAALRLHEGGVLNDVQQELITDIKAAVAEELGTDKKGQQAKPSGPEVIGAVEEVRGEETGPVDEGPGLFGDVQEEIAGYDPVKKPKLTDEEVGELVSMMRTTDAVTGETTVGAGVDIESLVNKIGAGMYDENIAWVGVKEPLQNAIDAVRGVEGGGKIKITVDRKTDTVIIEDDGVGMSPDTAQNEFLDIASSFKEEGASGRFGLGKVAYLAAAENFELVTVFEKEKTPVDPILSLFDTRDEGLPAGRHKTIIQGSASEWLNQKLKVTTEQVSDDVPTGTKLSITVSQKYEPRWVRAEMYMDVFFAENRTGAQVDFYQDYGYGIELYEPESPKYTYPDKPEISRPIPQGVVEIRSSEETAKHFQGSYGPVRQRVRVSVLNNGLYQFGDTWFMEVKGEYPASISFDVRSTAPATHIDYPFPTSRESLKGEAKEVYETYQQNIKDVATKKRKGAIATAVREPLQITSGGGNLYTTTETVSDATKKLVTDSRHMAGLNSAMLKTTEMVAEVFESEGLLTGSQVQFSFGIGIDDGWLGLNVHRKAVAELLGEEIGEEGNLILVNPFIIWNELIEHKTRDATPEQLARKTFATIVHEVTHNRARGHEEEFAGILTRALEPFVYGSGEQQDLLGIMEKTYAGFISDWRIKNGFERAKAEWLVAAEAKAEVKNVFEGVTDDINLPGDEFLMGGPRERSDQARDATVGIASRRERRPEIGREDETALRGREGRGDEGARIEPATLGGSGTVREDPAELDTDLFGEPIVSGPAQGDILPESEGPQGMSAATDNARAVTSLLKGQYESGALSSHEMRRYEEAQKLLRFQEGKGIDPATIQSEAGATPTDEFTIDMFPSPTSKEVREQMVMTFGSVDAGSKVVKEIVELDKKFGDLATYNLPGVMGYSTYVEAVEQGIKNIEAWTPMTGHNLAKEDGSPDSKKVTAIMSVARNPKFEHAHALAIDKNGFVVWDVLSKSGSLGSVSFDKMDLIKANGKAKESGGKVFIGHNHPSGKVKPSQYDIDTTRYAIQLAQAQGTVFGGHYIVNHNKAMVITAENIDAVQDMYLKKAEEKEFVEQFGVRLKGKRDALEWTSPDAKKVGNPTQMMEYLKALPEDESRVDIMFMSSTLTVLTYQSRHVEELATMSDWVLDPMREVGSVRLILGVNGKAAFDAAVAAARIAPADIVEVVDVTKPAETARAQELIPVRTDDEIIGLMEGLTDQVITPGSAVQVTDPVSGDVSLSTAPDVVDTRLGQDPVLGVKYYLPQDEASRIERARKKLYGAEDIGQVSSFGESEGRQVREEKEEYKLGEDGYELPGEGSRRKETDTPEGWYDHTQLPSLLLDIKTEGKSKLKKAVTVPFETAPAKFLAEKYSYYQESLIEVVRRQGGATGVEIAERGERVVDQTKLLLGRWDKARSDIEKLVSYGFKAQSAINYLQTPEKPAKGQHPAAVYSRIQGAVEGKIPLENMPKRARQVVEAIRELNSATGKHFQEVGLRQIKKEVQDDPQFSVMLDDVLTGKAKEDTVFRLFTPAAEGKVFLRMMTPHLKKIWMNPTTELRINPEWNQLVEMLAAENNMDAPTVGRIFNSSRQNASKRMHAEIPRAFKNFPTEMKMIGEDGVAGSGKSVPLLWTHPTSYAVKATAGSAHRAAFIEEFGQGLDDTTLSDAVSSAQQAGINPADTERLMRALGGLGEMSPMDDQDSPSHDIIGGFGHLMSIPRAMLLTRAFVPNTFEVAGNIQAFGGGPVRLAKMSKKLALATGADVAPTARGLVAQAPLLRQLMKTSVKLAESEEGWKALQKGYARQGLAQTWVMNATVDRQRPFYQSVPRIFREYALRAFPTVQAWKIQEMQAAAMGMVLADDMRAAAKPASSRLPKTVRQIHSRVADIQFESDLFVVKHILGFNDDQVLAFRNKEATDEMYVEIARRFASRSNTTRLSLPGEESRAANSPVFNQWIAFHRYSMMSVRNFDKLNAGFRKELEIYKNSDRTKKDKNRVYGAVKTFGLYQVGKTESGLGSILLLALLGGGLMGLGKAFDDILENPVAFMADAYASSQFGPIMNGWQRIVTQRKVENVWMLSAPASIMVEMGRFAFGTGKYQYMNAQERVLAVGGGMSPGPRAVWDVLASVGMTDTDPERDLAITRYWEFLRENDSFSGPSDFGIATKEDRKFRSNMRRAYDILGKERATSTSIEKAGEYVEKALEVEGKETSNVAASIRSRRLLPRVPDEQMDDLRKYLGPDLYSSLEQHDAIMTSWANSASGTRPQRVRERRPTRPTRRR